ncbi:MAG: TetR/AcrR family transcriptional regulator [Gemmatimonadetes bacterium]|uniref:TetR/AcrR family transcriptional regulator n=1 Tax=Candidatus Kutchimonas denitrificans TaxID=3056748 RepID=A0AAE5CBX4_9BACT|nr:TetR/AcrR family transcriptional regulator [Gemmatimonadota bacterium]NIR73514.1 TetR/AcrR family transcriptional regulator [Candidatus Kutchimonas denitrificans]NIR99473.1 TetR/AcrR family transcriptional regulator [Gemmatimonadota bacterium]NIT65093.1 TetR/AcrR family transcriptional regulator [Gemmatimonadota bacterium]NIV23626.1 TetR family transcriptional regulator [Gemmatimonadota bacterium]
MARSSRARDQLIDSARDLFYAHGYAAVGVQEICDQAGVNKGSFYHFFPSKRDLLAAVIDSHAAWLRGVLERSAVSKLSPLERIRRVFVLVGEFDQEVRRRTGQTIGCPIGNLAGELVAQDEGVRRRLEAVLGDGVAFFERQLCEAAAEGAIEVEDHRARAQAIMGYLEGLQLLAAARNEPGLLEALADGALRLAGAEASAVMNPRGQERER